MSKRETRREEFTTPQTFGWISFTQDLISSAFVLLQMGSSERKPGQPLIKGSHYCIHGPGSIVLLCTAFDQWLNESSLSLGVRYPRLREAAQLSTVQKYYKFSKLVSGKCLPIDEDLQMLWDVRNEIVHLLPRKTTSGKSWPSWLSSLEKRGLVLKVELPDRGVDFDLSGKLHSYSLARWAWQVIASAVSKLLEVFSEDDEVIRYVISCTASGFSMFKNLPE